jgi:hypothetical protein
MPLPSIDDIIAYLGRRSAAGKVARLTARTAAIVEAALRAHRERLQASAGPQQLAFRIDRWSEDGQRIAETLAWLSDMAVAEGAFNACRLKHPFDRVTLRRGAHLMAEQPASDRFAGDEATRARVAAWRQRERPVGGWPEEREGENEKARLPREQEPGL